jgi:hypothetical protein
VTKHKAHNGHPKTGKEGLSTPPQTAAMRCACCACRATNSLYRTWQPASRPGRVWLCIHCGAHIASTAIVKRVHAVMCYPACSISACRIGNFARIPSFLRTLNFSSISSRPAAYTHAEFLSSEACTLQGNNSRTQQQKEKSLANYT